jgi:hypothetical protein
MAAAFVSSFGSELFHMVIDFFRRMMVERRIALRWEKYCAIPEGSGGGR